MRSKLNYTVTFRFGYSFILWSVRNIWITSNARWRFIASRILVSNCARSLTIAFKDQFRQQQGSRQFLCSPSVINRLQNKERSPVEVRGIYSHANVQECALVKQIIRRRKSQLSVAFVEDLNREISLDKWRDLQRILDRVILFDIPRTRLTIDPAVNGLTCVQNISRFNNCPYRREARAFLVY